MNANQGRVPIVEIGAAEFEAEVLRANEPVVVAFWAPWSQPCHVLDSTLDEVAAACAGSAKLVKVNADDNPDLSLWYDVQSIPTLLYFVDGSPRARLVGTASKEAILAKLQAISVVADAKPLSSFGNHEHEPGNR
jgi:thioredoxin 1